MNAHFSQGIVFLIGFMHFLNRFWFDKISSTRFLMCGFFVNKVHFLFVTYFVYSAIYLMFLRKISFAFSSLLIFLSL